MGAAAATHLEQGQSHTPGPDGRLTGIKAGMHGPRPWLSMQSPVNSALAMKLKHPYAVPARLSPDLTRVQAYWRGLLRGSAQIPFWDDAKLSDLPDLAERLFLVDVFQKPERFRFGLVGQALATDGLSGRFLDETDLDRPFDFLRSQCAAAVEGAGPTLFHQSAGARPYARLLLPMWGDGRISMLLGAVDEG